MIELSTAAGQLAALASEPRLAVYELLARAGPGGLSAGTIAERLGIGQTALSFHLNRLQQAGLVRSRRQGRRIFFSAEFAALRGVIAFLSESCCAESGAKCDPDCDTVEAVSASSARERSA